MEANRGYDSLVDVSRYTEMEAEHGHDTINTFNVKHGVHSDVKFVNKTPDSDVKRRAFA